jgi:serine/threonine protein kinase
MGRVYIGGEMLGGRYEIESYIDEGGMQEVYLARDRVFGREVVVKVPKNDSAVKRFKTTAVLSARVTHPNIAMTLDYFEEQGLAHLVEEYLPGGNLSDALMSHIEALDPHLVAKLLNHLSKGLAAAHHVDVVHRDLKPSNIVLNGDLSRFTPKITDFGVAKMAQEAMAIAVEGGASSITASKTAIGHLPYMAPELIEDAGRVRKPSDIWAIGALGYEMLSGTKPYGQGLLAVTAIMAAEPLTLPKFVSRSRDFRSLGCAVFTVIAACVKRD